MPGIYTQLRIGEIANILMNVDIGHPVDRIPRDVGCGFISNSAQVKEYGIIGDIIDRPRA